MSEIKLKVSTPTFHEIAQLMEASGQKLTDKDTITLTKDIALERPLDWRLIQVRKDCVAEAAKVWNNDIPQTFIECCNMLYNFVLLDKVPDKPEVTGVDQTTKIESKWK